MASRSGIMNGTFEFILPSAGSTRDQGSFRISRKLRSSIASIFSVTPISSWPTASRLPQRRIEAMQSAEVTGAPSCHFRPSRSVMVYTLPSSLKV